MHVEAGPQGRNVQQVKYLADRETAVGQLEQVLNGNQQRVTAALPLVGQGVGDEAAVVALDLTKHGADMRSVAVDIRHHHDHITRLQVRIVAKSLE